MQPLILMGILNITPDSFSDGGLYYHQEDTALSRAKKMLADGADIIDVGGESTRPGAKAISVAEELERVLPIIRKMRNELGANFDISIDTFKSKVAEEALRAGATMVNSLGGFTFDPRLAEVVAKTQCKVVLYHIKGKPQTMQKGTITYSDVTTEINNFFEGQLIIADKFGIKRDSCILDPGIGFGKTVDHNLEIIRNVSAFKKHKLPILIGVSRKGHLGMVLQNKLGLKDTPEPLERLEAGLAETAVAIINGATLVRTHDVKETKKFLTVLEELL